MADVLVDFTTPIKTFSPPPPPLLDKVKGQANEIDQQLKQVQDMLEQASNEEATKLVDQRHQLFEQPNLDQLVHLVTHGEPARDNAIVDKRQRQVEGQRNVPLQKNLAFSTKSTPNQVQATIQASVRPPHCPAASQDPTWRQ